MESVEKIGQKLLEYLQSTEAFVKEQAPDFVRELLAYQLMTSTMWAVFCGLVFAAGVAGFVYGVVKRSDEYGPETGILIPSAMFIILGFLFCAGNTEKALKIHFAPKVYVMEYARDMMKGNCK